MQNLRLTCAIWDSRLRFFLFAVSDTRSQIVYLHHLDLPFDAIEVCREFLGPDEIPRIVSVDFACYLLYLVRFLVPVPNRHGIADPTLSSGDDEPPFHHLHHSDISPGERFLQQRIDPAVDVTWGDLARHDELVREFPDNFGYD